VVVRVAAATINIDDIHVAEGTFYGGLPIGPRPKADRPVVPGSDLAGTVVAVGSKVRSVQVGDAVFGVQIPFRAGGAWAELCAVNESWIARKPESVSFATAAASGVSGLVALSAVQAVKAREGRRMVIVGATGGIGAMAVQLATRTGAEVIGICGTRNIERAYRLGCSLVVDYSSGPWDVTLREQERAPVDGVLDMVGGRDAEEMGRRVLKKDGVFASVVGPVRFIGDQPLGWSAITRILAHVGWRTVKSYLHGPRYVLTGPGAGGGGALTEVATEVAAGVLPPIDSKVPFELEPMREALRRAKRHENNGRIVVEIGEHRAGYKPDSPGTE